MDGITRRSFVGGAVSAALVPSSFAGTDKEMRAVLLHLGQNEWGDWLGPGEKKDAGRNYTCDHVRFDEAVWREATARLQQRGMNTLLMDLGEFLEYPSHPELAVTGSWKPDRLREELRRIRSLGLEPIPKLNFSAGHDSWLKEYHRMLSTRTYYQVCADLIKDVCEIFDRPRFFHLGYDEESAGHQARQTHVTVRQGELWWHDFLWFCRGVTKLGMRPWIWSDYGWYHDDFAKRCPTNVLQSNWYYNERMGGFDLGTSDKWSASVLRLYETLDEAGFDQVPCASNWNSPERQKAGLKDNDGCMADLVRFCRAHVSADRLKGFMMAPWSNCENRGANQRNLAGIDQLAAALGEA